MKISHVPFDLPYISRFRVEVVLYYCRYVVVAGAVFLDNHAWSSVNAFLMFPTFASVAVPLDFANISFMNV